MEKRTKKTLTDEQIERQYKEKKAAWLKRNGFDERGYTCIITGETFSIKDELKEKGYLYDPVLRWHKADDIEEEYKDRYITININDFAEFNIWGKPSYKRDMLDSLNKAITGNEKSFDSEWIGEVGEVLENVKVKVIKKLTFQGRYGVTTLLSFVTEEGNILNWFTSTFPRFNLGDEAIIKTTIIKKHDEYKGEKSTVILRPKFNR